MPCWSAIVTQAVSTEGTLLLVKGCDIRYYSDITPLWHQVGGESNSTKWLRVMWHKTNLEELKKAEVALSNLWLNSWEALGSFSWGQRSLTTPTQWRKPLAENKIMKNKVWSFLHSLQHRDQLPIIIHSRDRQQGSAEARVRGKELRNNSWLLRTELGNGFPRQQMQAELYNLERIMQLFLSMLSHKNIYETLKSKTSGTKEKTANIKRHMHYYVSSNGNLIQGSSDPLHQDRI